jgi:hypothetical protein
MPTEFFGDDVMIEQRSAPVKPVALRDGTGTPVMTQAGKPVTYSVPNVDGDGNPILAWVVYERMAVVDGIHPWTGDKTSETFVWMPVAECGTVEEARQTAEQLRG